MEYIEEGRRSDGAMSSVTQWRLGGSGTGVKQRETFGIGSDAQNRGRAEDVRDMVTLAGEMWPGEWAKGAGYVRHRSSESVAVAYVGLEYVDQILDCSPASAPGTRGNSAR